MQAGTMTNENESMAFGPLYTDEGLDSDDKIGNDYKYNIYTDNSWFSKIYLRTLGGSLPFIFSPDSSSSNPENFIMLLTVR